MSGTLESLADSGLLARLPSVANAKLPAAYVAAQKALAECSRIDECQEWANKSEALASYAKQAKDDQLRKLADRIQARAIRRCGVLLKQVPVNHDRGNQHRQRTVADTRPTRTSAAANAGLSKRQKDTALQVASVPEPDFERQVESESPPTVTRLAEQGKKTKLLDLGDSKPKNFALATKALAALRRFAEFCEAYDAAEVATGVRPSEISTARKHVRAVDSWLDQFVTRLPE